ncbi:rhodanese-like domain-containing protein [Prevotella sp.]
MKKLLTAILAALGIGMGACAQNLYEDVDVNRFEQIIKSDSVQLVDVRKLDEFAEGHIAGAIHIDVLTTSFLSNALAKLDKKRPCAVYCRSGKRSAMAATLLAKEGYTVTNLSGGIIAWTEAKKKTVKE